MIWLILVQDSRQVCKIYKQDKHNYLVTKAQNAASQFNATSENQGTQFFANLSTSVQTANVQRADAMNQFATAEANKISAQNANNATGVSQANAQTEAQINQFNSQLQDQRKI